MQKRITIVAVWLAGLALSLAQPAAPKNVVFKPTFITGYDSFTAGTAFVCETADGKQQLLLTAQHLLGTAGGFESEIPWDKLNDVVKLTAGISMDNYGVSISSKRALLIQGAHALDDKNLADDIAAFVLDSDKSRPTLKLAKVAPKNGDQLWLYGRQRGGDKLEFYPCKAVRSDSRELDYEFDSKSIKFPGTSGAPVLNSNGEVVAINIGGSEQKNGKLVGYGNPLLSIVSHLEKALKN